MAKRVEAERTAASYIMTADDTSTAVLASEWPMARYNHAAWSVPCGSGYLCFYIFGGVASIGNPAYTDPASGVGRQLQGGRNSINERTLTVLSDLWQMTQLTEPTAASQANAYFGRMAADAQGQAAPPKGGKVRSSLLRASSSFWKLLGNKGHSDKGSTPVLRARHCDV